MAGHKRKVELLFTILTGQLLRVSFPSYCWPHWILLVHAVCLFQQGYHWSQLDSRLSTTSSACRVCIMSPGKENDTFVCLWQGLCTNKWLKIEVFCFVVFHCKIKYLLVTLLVCSLTHSNILDSPKYLVKCKKTMLLKRFLSVKDIEFKIVSSYFPR